MIAPPEAALLDVLRKNRDTFIHYGDQHIAKDPPQLGKAQVNYENAAEVNAAILTYLRDCQPV